MSSPELREGDRRHAAVLFADMANFTPFSEERDPEEVDRVMGEIFADFESIVTSYGGSVEKYIGDALVAVFGVPEVHEDDARRAVSAARTFLTSPVAHKHGAQFRSGVHSGLVTTGRRGEFDVVTGHAMAVASRLQGAAAPGSVLVSETVAGAIRDSFVLSEPRELQLKGNEQPVTVRTVLDVASVDPSDADNELPFVGRESILQELTQLYLSTTGGRRASALLVGEPGVGSSRVARRFLSEVQQFPRFDAPIMAVRSAPASGTRFASVLAAVRRHLSIPDEPDADAIEQGLSALTGLDPALLPTIRSFLTNDSATAAPDVLYPAIGALMRAILTGGSLFTPIVYLEHVDDLSPEEQELLRFLLSEPAGPAFLLATVQDARAPGAVILPEITTIEVPPFSAEETARFIAELRQGTPDDEFVADIHARTGGNPTFIAELLRYLEVNPNTNDIPAGIQTVVLAGMRSLSDPAREMLRALSVLHHQFSAKIACALSGVDAPDAVAELCDKRYLRSDDRHLEFANELVRSALYDSLLHHNRRLLHGRAAELVDSREFSPVVRLHHLAYAEHVEQALPLIMSQAADQNARVNPQIVPILDQVLATGVADLGTRSALLAFRTAILLNTGADRQTCEQSIGQLFELVSQTSDFAVQANAFDLLSGYHQTEGRLVESLIAAEQALEAVRAAESREREWALLLRLATLENSLGRPEKSQWWIAQMPEPAHRLVTTAHALVSECRYAEAYEAARSAIRTARGSELPNRSGIIGHGLIATGFALMNTGAWDELSSLEEEARRHFSAFPEVESQAYSLFAIAANQSGSDAAAEAHLDRARYLLNVCAPGRSTQEAAITVAMAEVTLGKAAPARERLQALSKELHLTPNPRVLDLHLELLVRATSPEDPRRQSWLAELDVRVRVQPATTLRTRTVNAWLHGDPAQPDADPARLAEARELTERIIALQGNSRFAETIRHTFPYREILSATE